MYSKTLEDQFFSDESPKFNFHSDNIDLMFKPEIDLSEKENTFILPIDVDQHNLDLFCKGPSQYDDLSIKGLVEEDSHSDLPTGTTVKKFDFSFVADLKEETKPKIKNENDLNKSNSHKDFKVKRKRKTNLSNSRRRRKDIIFKSILRRCRKFYQAEFNKF